MRYWFASVLRVTMSVWTAVSPSPTLLEGLSMAESSS